MDKKPEIIISEPTNDDVLLENIGIHEDYIEALSKGEPYGAEVIDLSERRKQ